MRGDYTVHVSFVDGSSADVIVMADSPEDALNQAMPIDLTIVSEPD